MLAIIPAAIIGLACGGLGILFTIANLKVARLRQAFMQGNKRWQIMEPCILIGAFVVLGMLLPLFFPCTPTQCVQTYNGQGIAPTINCTDGGTPYEK